MRSSLLLGYAALFVGPDIARALRDMPVDDRALGLGFYLGFLALMAVVTLWVIHQIQIGRNWARMVMLGLTVFGILSVLRTAGSDPPVSLLMNAVDTLIDVTAMVLLFKPPGSDWFRSPARTG